MVKLTCKKPQKKMQSRNIMQNSWDVLYLVIRLQCSPTIFPVFLVGVVNRTPKECMMRGCWSRHTSRGILYRSIVFIAVKVDLRAPWLVTGQTFSTALDWKHIWPLLACMLEFVAWVMGIFIELIVWIVSDFPWFHEILVVILYISN